jgi:membrane-associated phospholipid phosphatase
VQAMNFRRRIASLAPADSVTISFFLLLTLLNLIFHTRVDQWWILVPLNLLVVVFIVWLASAAEARPTPLLVGIHRWYLYVAVVGVFKELYLLVRPIHPTDYDALFIAIDRWLFGVNPTEWLYQFAHPLITELLQLAYFGYYIIFIILGVELYRHRPIETFDRAAFMIVYGFYLSYVGYFLLPAVGPRFTLHDFASLDAELPGLLLAEPLRHFINGMESIPSAVPNPQDFVQRDVFPSGHTQMALVVTFLAFETGARSRWLILSITSLMIVATVYLRYHYVIDLIGGAAFFIFTIYTGKKLEPWWNKTRRALRGEISPGD